LNGQKKRLRGRSPRGRCEEGRNDEKGTEGTEGNDAQGEGPPCGHASVIELPVAETRKKGGRTSSKRKEGKTHKKKKRPSALSGRTKELGRTEVQHVANRDHN